MIIFFSKFEDHKGPIKLCWMTSCADVSVAMSLERSESLSYYLLEGTVLMLIEKRSLRGIEDIEKSNLIHGGQLVE